MSAVAFSPDGRQLASAGDDADGAAVGRGDRAGDLPLQLGPRVVALAWGACGIAVAAHTNVIRLDVVCRSDGAVPRSAAGPRDD